MVIHHVVKQRGISWMKLSSMLRLGTGSSEVVTRKERWKTGRRHAEQCTSVPLHAMTVERASGQVRLEGHVKRPRSSPVCQVSVKECEATVVRETLACGILPLFNAGMYIHFLYSISRSGI